MFALVNNNLCQVLKKLKTSHQFTKTDPDVAQGPKLKF